MKFFLNQGCYAGGIRQWSSRRQTGSTVCGTYLSMSLPFIKASFQALYSIRTSSSAQENPCSEQQAQDRLHRSGHYKPIRYPAPMLLAPCAGKGTLSSSFLSTRVAMQVEPGSGAAGAGQDSQAGAVQAHQCHPLHHCRHHRGTHPQVAGGFSYPLLGTSRREFVIGIIRSAAMPGLKTVHIWHRDLNGHVCCAGEKAAGV